MDKKQTVEQLRAVALESISSVAEYLSDALFKQKIGDYGSAKTTVYDVEAEKTITKILKTTELPVLGEELSSSNFSESTWVVDPIDGTGWFMRGVPRATTMVSLFLEHKPILGLINNFGTGKMLVCEQGKGVRINGSIAKSSSSKLKGAYIEVHGDDAHARDIDFKRELWRSGTFIVNNAAMGFSFMQLASGQLDAVVVLPSAQIKLWDYLPGILPVIESGGIAKSSDKNLISSEIPLLVLAANERIAEELTSVLYAHGFYKGSLTVLK